MRVVKIKWKRDTHNVFDRMHDEPWWCLQALQDAGAVIDMRPLTWSIRWPDILERRD